VKAGWKSVSLGEVCSFENGDRGENYPGRKAFVPEGVPFVNAGHLSDGLLDLSEMNFIPRDHFNRLGAGKLRLGDLLFCLRGSLGKFALVDNIDEGAIASSLVIVRPSPRLAPKFLKHYFGSTLCAEMVATYANGTAQPNLSARSLAAFQLPLPPLEEQQQIVAVLDEAFEGLTRARAHAEANLRDARELFENALVGIFDDLQGTAPRMTLAAASITFGRGKSRHRPRNAPFLYGGDYPFVQTGDIRNSSGTVSSFTQTYSEKGLAQSKLWPAGTICITIAANIAETAVLGFDACFPDSIIGMVADQNITFPEYVEFMLRYFAAELKALGKGSAQDNINLATFEAATFPFPSIPTQVEAVEKLSRLTDATTLLSEAYRAKLERIDALRQSLLQKAFAGELT
jgi:type I restriction enzyme, S subunit